MELKCRKISGGKAQGSVILSKDSVCFYLAEPENGVIVEKNHDIEGKCIAGKILVMPSGKGSSVVQADGLYKLAMKNNAPAAMIIEHPDTVLVSGAIVMEIPMVHKVDPKFFEIVKDGDTIVVDADNEIIRIAE